MGWPIYAGSYGRNLVAVTKTFEELRDTNTKLSFANSLDDSAFDDVWNLFGFLKGFRCVVESAASPNEKRKRSRRFRGNIQIILDTFHFSALGRGLAR